MSFALTRRGALRGMLGGTAVTVALPYLDCFLNTNGTALAATGQRLPVRFGTWFWGLGITPARWIPKNGGPGYDIPIELKAIEPFKDQVTICSGFAVNLDGKTNFPHGCGHMAIRTGITPSTHEKAEAPTIDMLVADVIGTGTRFRSLEVTTTGDAKHSYSFRNATAMNPSETSPLALYTRIFGPEFQDPNAGVFKPDPRAMVQKSVLSGVAAQREKLMRQVGAADRARLDQYFTSLRQIEQQFELQLQKPPPAEACKVPQQPKDAPVGVEIGQATRTHDAMAQLLAMALACNQTRVFNMVFSQAASRLRKEGSGTAHHQLTHEEQADAKLGYQPDSTFFVEQSMASWGRFVRTMAEFKEGDGSLLDNCAVFAHSDTQFAKVHDIVGIPMMIAGKAGGRLKSGIHLKGNGDPVSRIGLTLQQAMGVPVDKWGGGSMQTSKSITDILA
ncbi:MAG: DUF1552 domain-containing protein [Rhodospirillaceae bacterium]|nr:DUF1552 domain-containing protein [Rhodospirillaceae bacterium]